MEIAALCTGLHPGDIRDDSWGAHVKRVLFVLRGQLLIAAGVVCEEVDRGIDHLHFVLGHVDSSLDEATTLDLDVTINKAGRVQLGNRFETGFGDKCIQ